MAMFTENHFLSYGKRRCVKANATLNMSSRHCKSARWPKAHCEHGPSPGGQALTLQSLTLTVSRCAM